MSKCEAFLYPFFYFLRWTKNYSSILNSNRLKCFELEFPWTLLLLCHFWNSILSRVSIKVVVEMLGWEYRHILFQHSIISKSGKEQVKSINLSNLFMETDKGTPDIFRFPVSKRGALKVLLSHFYWALKSSEHTVCYCMRMADATWRRGLFKNYVA